MCIRTLIFLLGALGCFPHVTADSFRNNARTRVKRFLFNKNNEPQVTYATDSNCCECDDFQDLNSCYDRCRVSTGLHGFKACPGKACLASATLINDRYYIVSGCAEESECIQTAHLSSQVQGCDTLKHSDMINGTTCSYCCKDPNARAHGASLNYNCTSTIEDLIQHTYSQHSNTALQTHKPPDIPIFELNKHCLPDEIKNGKYDFPYPGDPTKYIQCDDSGSATPKDCPPTLVWNDAIETCDFSYNVKIEPTSTSSSTSSLTLKQSSATAATSIASRKESTSISSPTRQETSTSPKTSTISTTNKDHFTLAPTTTQRGIGCHTCHNEADCDIVICDPKENYCLNTVRIYPNGSRRIVKKSCVSELECRFDHSDDSLCESIARTNASSTVGVPISCQYCCVASNKSNPCNEATIPTSIEWFNKTSSTSSTTTLTPPLSNSAALSSNNITTAISTESGTNSSTSLPKSSSVNNNSTTPPHLKTSASSSKMNTTKGATLSLIFNRTTTITTKTTTLHQPYTLPPKATKCQVCTVPEFLCERVMVEKQCEYPNQYCVNSVSNYRNGSRTVERRCDNFENCYRDWFLGSSDSDKCRKFDEHQVLTLEFSCTYCCVTDNCNRRLRPSDDDLYKDIN